MAFDWQKTQPEAQRDVAAAGAPQAEVGETVPNRAQVERAPHSESLLDEGSTFEGKYSSGRDLRISGQAQGEIACSGTLTIDEMGRVSATVEAVNAYIAGTYEGKLNCSGRVELADGCRVTGQIRAGTLVVQDGARLSGKVETTAGTGVLDFEPAGRKSRWRSESADGGAPAPEDGEEGAEEQQVSSPPARGRRSG